jgi:c(7)-type cytochrome triheme protein
MRLVITFLITISLASVGTVTAQDKKPPRTLVFPSKAGEVTFNHAAHLKREKDDCATCHDKLWPQSAKVPVKSSAGCGTCHHAEGKSFEMKGNCIKCHAAKGNADRPGSK